MSVPERLPSSFRDPSGYVYREEGVLLRRIHPSYYRDYEHLMSSGLYESLVTDGLLIPHDEVRTQGLDSGYRVIRPREVAFVSYPYEWCFSELKDAALLTLEIQKRALKLGMGLKDASAFNVQFHRGSPIWVDTLSFERYVDGAPWVAYGQFCRHFVAPLALVAHVDPRLLRLFESQIDGLPLDLTSRLLPWQTWFSWRLLAHIHGHARSQRRFGGTNVDIRKMKVSRQSLLALIENLEAVVTALRWRPAGTPWLEYYDDTNYTSVGAAHKAEVVSCYLEAIRPKVAWDLGCNVGTFSRIVSAKGIRTVAFDMDPAAVEKAYRTARASRDEFLLPLRLDLSSPSPALGWSHRERDSLVDRGPADVTMALALVHHLCLTGNVPLDEVARFLSTIGHHLIVEFVPFEDSQVSRMLASRLAPTHPYSQTAFESSFRGYFAIDEQTHVRDSGRVLYRMHRRVD